MKQTTMLKLNFLFFLIFCKLQNLVGHILNNTFNNRIYSCLVTKLFTIF